MENSETDTKEIQNCQEPTEECKEKVEQPDEPMDNPIDSPGKETEENGQANIEETTPSDEREENGSEKVIARKVRKSETRKKIKEMQSTKNKKEGKADDVVDPEDNDSIKERKMSIRLPLAVFIIILLFAAIGVTVYLLYEHNPELFSVVTEGQSGMTTVSTTTTTPKPTTTPMASIGNMMLNRQLRIGRV